jgi:hypothetical protein
VSTPRNRLLAAFDRALALGIASLVAGTALGFGGAAWWSPALIAGLAGLIAVLWTARAAASWRWTVLKSPLMGLGVLVLALAVVQSLPIPARIARAVSPTARSIHTVSTLPELAREDDPDAEPAELISSERSPLTVDRPATLRWLGGAAACLALFWVASHFTDCLKRLYLVWGSVVAVFLLNAAIALIQLVGQSDGMYGFIEPGKGPVWAPTAADAIAAPGATALRSVGTSRPTPHAWALPSPDRTRFVGTMMGGAGAILALGAIGLPLALALTLHLIAPRGSREGLWVRLGESGQGSLLVLLYAFTIIAALVVGMVSGTGLAVPFAVGIILVGVPSLFGTGLGWKGLILTTLTLTALGGGVALGGAWPSIFPTANGLPRVEFTEARAVWSDARAIARDFPLVGVGFGSFPTIQPYYKTRDASSTTAMSSLLQWWAESGAVGLAILGIAALWGLVRLPGAIRRVGSGDRALAFGMIGAPVCFAGVSALHWTVELAAVALAASAVAGSCNRWLAGGTDLFVERG